MTAVISIDVVYMKGSSLLFNFGDRDGDGGENTDTCGVVFWAVQYVNSKYLVY